MEILIGCAAIILLSFVFLVGKKIGFDEGICKSVDIDECDLRPSKMEIVRDAIKSVDEVVIVPQELRDKIVKKMYENIEL